ncbi:MAG: RidA family protein [Candidatus Rokubacteria bacterium]|nr:RidA family protein [Candidatus Rokubacteria bacterium]
MPRTVVNPPDIVKPVGFSHGVAVTGGRLLFLAGQVAFDKDGHVVGKGDIAAQFRQVCENMKAIIASQGGTLQDVVSMTIYVLDRASYQAHGKAIGQVYREYFGRHYPAMTLVEVKGLYDGDLGCMLEIQAVAVLG